MSELENKGGVRPLPLFWIAGAISMGVGLFFFMIIGFFVRDASIGVASFFLLFFGGMGLPLVLWGLCTRVEFDENGFTYQNMLHIRRTYAYEEITGRGSDSGHFIIQMNYRKKIDFSCNQMLGIEAFRDIVNAKTKNRKLDILHTSIMNIDGDDLAQSYVDGALGKALVVKGNADHIKRYHKFKRIHYVICTISGLCAFAPLVVGYLFSLRDFYYKWVALMVLCHVLFLVSFILLLRYPQFFTLREKGRYIHVKNHKLCTSAYVSCWCFFGTLLLLLPTFDSEGGLSRYNFDNPITGIVIALGILIFLALIILSKCYSWEYVHFKVGLLSGGFWFFMYASSVVMLWISFLCGVVLRR